LSHIVIGIYKGKQSKLGAGGNHIHRCWLTVKHYYCQGQNMTVT